jgi:hypothetical protein
MGHGHVKHMQERQRHKRFLLAVNEHRCNRSRPSQIAKVVHYLESRPWYVYCSGVHVSFVVPLLLDHGWGSQLPSSEFSNGAFVCWSACPDVWTETRTG